MSEERGTSEWSDNNELWSAAPLCAVCLHLMRRLHRIKAMHSRNFEKWKRATMQVKLFTIPVGDSGTALDEMNRFLRGNKILEVQNQLISNENGAYWCFCVRYIERTGTSTSETRSKVDYKHVLDETTFQKFSRLREIRKKVAADEGLPAFAIFTDEELAGLAKLEVINRQTMLSIKGIGDKKVERFAEHFITISEKDETTGTAN